MKLNLKMVSAFFFVFFLCSCTTENGKKSNPDCDFSTLDGQSGRVYVRNLVTSSFVKSLHKYGDVYFQELDNLIGQLNDKNCKLADGRYALNFISSGFKRTFERINDKDLILNKLKVMQKKYPEAVYLVLAEANVWIYYAWEARGKGYASSVTPQGWELFREHLAVAEKILTDNKKRASISPLWYELMSIPLFHLNHTQEEKNKFYSEGFKRHKNFLPLYIIRRNQLRPRWGGSWEKVDGFINWSAEHTKEIEGLGMYARLYFGVYDNLRRNENLFESTLADWSKLKAGFNDLVRLYPNSEFHKNVFALMACEANDKDAYHGIRKKISKHTQWIWSTKFDVNICDKIFEYSENKTLGQPK